MNKLFSKFINYSFGNWVNAFLGIITIPLITRIVSTSEYAQISMFLLSMNLLMLIASLGMEHSFVRFYYNETRPQNLLKFCLKGPSIILLLISAAIWFNKESISYFLFNEVNENLIILLILGLIFQLFNRFSLLLIRMEKKAALYSVLNIGTKLIELLIILICYTFIQEVYLLVISAQIISIVITTFIAMIKEKDKWLSLYKKNISQSPSTEKREIIKYAIPFMPTMIVTALFQWVDRLTLRSLSDFEQLGLYSAAYKIIAILSIIQYSFSSFWTPISFERFKNHPSDKLFFRNITDYLSVFMFLLAIITIIFKDTIIILLGDNFKDAALIIPFLIFVPIMHTLSEVTVVGINFMRKTYWHIVISIISLGINFLGNLFLVPKIGARGAAISTGVSYIIFFTLRTIASNRYFFISYDYLRMYSSIFLICALCYYTTFNSQSINTLMAGLFSLCYVLWIYRKVIFKIHYFLRGEGANVLTILSKVKNIKN